MNCLVLWDVDHTLVENSGVSKETYAAAFQALAGRPPRQPARTDGRTDRLIMADMFRAHDLQVPAWDAVYAALEAAGAERYAAMRERGWILPGAAEAIARLAGRAGTVQSLLTGNILPNARMKVTALGLGAELDFEVGAYGSDSDDRAELVCIAQHRASIAYRSTFDRSNTLLIGDTPRDIEAAERGGAQIVAVASGLYTLRELAADGDVTVLADLADTERLMSEIDRMIPASETPRT